MPIDLKNSGVNEKDKIRQEIVSIRDSSAAKEPILTN